MLFSNKYTIHIEYILNIEAKMGLPVNNGFLWGGGQKGIDFKLTHNRYSVFNGHFVR